MVTKVLPSRLPPVVVASPDSEDVRVIKDILDRYIKPFGVTIDGYDQFSSCTNGRFTFNLLTRYFRDDLQVPTIFVSSALKDGRGWVYEQSLTPGFYFCLGGGSAGPDPTFGTTQKDMEKIETLIGPQSSPEQLRMLDIYRRCGENWEKVERFLEYSNQATMIELRHKSQPFMYTASAVRVVTPMGIVSRIAGLEDAIASYFEDPEDSEDSK